MDKKLLYVRISGTGFSQTWKCVSHEVIGYPAGTYHVFKFEDGSIVYLNDFGIRTVTIADAPEKLV